MSEEKTGLTIKTAPITSRPARIASPPRSSSASKAVDQRSDRADRSHDGRHRDRHRLRHHHAAAPAQPQHRRAASRDRRVRHAEPPPRVHCRPTLAAEETPCAGDIVRRLATQAFRGRSATRTSRLMTFYARGRKEKNFEFGVTKALEAILASPQFLFRLEETPARPPCGANAPIGSGDYELASRLSFFLWGTRARCRAAEGWPARAACRRARRLAKQAGGMLADPRADALSTRFASQWLRLQDSSEVMPDPILYPYSDQTLSLALKKRDRAVLRQPGARGPQRARAADGRLHLRQRARGAPLRHSERHRHRVPRVTLPDERRGILGHGSVLTLTSVADRTSPVMRGKWVMEVLLGSPPPPPPPNVPALEETKGTTETGRADGARAHGAAPQQSAVHVVPSRDRSARAWRSRTSTPPASGASRTAACAVDTTAGQLYDGTPIDGPAGLRAALLRHQDVVLLSFTRA